MSVAYYPAQLRSLITEEPVNATFMNFATMSEKCAAIKAMIDMWSEHPMVREYAVKVCQNAGAEQRDTLGQTRALLEHVQNDFYYVHEKLETFQTPLYTIRHRFGDCDDFCICLGAMLESITIPVVLEILGTYPGPLQAVNWEHIYLRAGHPAARPTKWIALETTLPLPFGTEPSDYLASLTRRSK